jgi:hypothetical protein
MVRSTIMRKRNWLKPLTALALLGSSMHGMRAEQPGSPIPATTFESGVTQTTLLELFTSEGCSSCPPAEKRISQLKSNPDLWKKIVPIAFHVDYWDHLGWRDRFAKAEFTERQRNYAAAWREDSVYTPAFVSNGQEWRSWFNDNAPHLQSEKVGTLSVTLSDDKKVNGTFVSEGAKLRSLKLEVALLGNDLESDVKRGENSGRKLRHDFVVLQFANIDMVNEANRWTGSTALPKQSGDDKPGAIAAWVTSAETGAPIQATGGWLKP